MFFDHSIIVQAVISLGVSSPVSICQTVRTLGDHPSGQSIGPSISYLVPYSELIIFSTLFAWACAFSASAKTV